MLQRDGHYKWCSSAKSWEDIDGHQYYSQPEVSSTTAYSENKRSISSTILAQFPLFGNKLLVDEWNSLIPRESPKPYPLSTLLRARIPTSVFVNICILDLHLVPAQGKFIRRSSVVIYCLVSALACMSGPRMSNLGSSYLSGFVAADVKRRGTAGRPTYKDTTPRHMPAVVCHTA